MMRRTDQRARDAALAEHEAGHPDSDRLLCLWCRRNDYPASIDDPIPQADVPERQTRGD